MSEPIEGKNACPKCGAALASAATAGLCPRCLMAEAMMGTQDEATGPTGTKILPPQNSLTPAELAPHFPQLEILECLGRGGMGVVYKARQKTLNRFVAIKLLAPERVADAKFAQRFAHEAQALAALNHPGIVTIYDFGQAGGFYFLLMEFVDGVNLRQAIKAGRFTPEQALAIVPPVCEALQYAHERGIVHRDIKPENLLLDKEGRVKIADFGIAKMLHSDSSGDTLVPDALSSFTASAGQPRDKSVPDTFASAAGTPHYMAPEQREHHRTDHRADIYSLGVVLYELLTGELPADKLQPPSRKVQIDVRLDEIVLRALEKTPELRFQTAGEFRTQVETMVATPPPGKPSAPTASAGAQWQSPTMGWGYLVGIFFGITFTSPLAFTLANLSALGFLGFLGFIGVSEIGALAWCRGFFGFLGFFGLTGVAFIVEMAHRRNATPQVPMGADGAGDFTPPPARAAAAAEPQTTAAGGPPVPSASASEYVSSWGFRITPGPAIKTGYVRFWESLFGSVNSPGAINALNLSRIGFIGILAPLAILPGWRWCWPAFGFLGMFGMISAAYLSEATARSGVDLSKTDGADDARARRAIWRRRIVWLVIGGGIIPMAFFALGLFVSLERGGEKAMEAATFEQMVTVFAKVLGVGLGLTFMIWVLLRVVWPKPANAANPWPRHPEALVALSLLWPLLLITAPFVVWQFVGTSAERLHWETLRADPSRSALMNSTEWTLWCVVLVLVAGGAIEITRNLRRTMCAMDDPSASPERAAEAPTSHPIHQNCFLAPAFLTTAAAIVAGTLCLVAQSNPPGAAVRFLPLSLGPLFVSLILSLILLNRRSQRVLLVGSLLYAMLFAFIYLGAFFWHLDPQSAIALLFIGFYSLPVMIPVWLIALVLYFRDRSALRGGSHTEPRGDALATPEIRSRWQGWEVWVIGLSLAAFGALWLMRLTDEQLLHRPLFVGAGGGLNIVLPIVLATTILLAGAAFLYLLAKNIKTPAATRPESWKRTLGRSIVPAIAVALLLRSFVIQPFWSVTDATAPEIPSGSLVLVWKPTRTFAAGELIAYVEKGRVNLGRIDKPSREAVFVKRNDSEPTSVLHSAIVGKVMSVLWRASGPSGVTQFDIVPVGVSNNVVIVDVTTEVKRGVAEVRVVLDGPLLSAKAEAALANAFSPPFTGTLVQPLQDRSKQPSRSLSPGRQTWRLGFVLPNAALAKKAFDDIRPIGPLPAVTGRTSAGTLFEVSDSKGQEFHATLQVALPFTPADPNWVAVSPAPSTPDTSAQSSYNESGGVIMNWEVLASQPGLVFLQRDGGQSTGSLRRDPQTKFYQANVRLELAQAGTNRVRLVTRIGAVTANEELTGNLRDLSAELWNSKNMGVTNARGTEIALCHFQGKPIKVQVPALISTVATSGTATSPVIQRVEVSRDKAVVHSAHYDGSGLLITFGTGTNRWTPSGLFLDGLFNVTLEWSSAKSGARHVIQPRHGLHFNYRLDGPPGPMLGKLVFRPGSAQPDAEGSCVIGEFRPDTGEPLPLAVQLVADQATQPRAASPSSITTLAPVKMVDWTVPFFAVIGLCLIGGIVVVIMLARRNGTAGRIVLLLVSLPVLLLIIVLAWYSTARTGRTREELLRAEVATERAKAEPKTGPSSTAAPAVIQSAAKLHRREVKEKTPDGRDVAMTFTELRRDPKTSIATVKSVGAGSVGSAMFIARGAYDIARARGAAYFINLKEWEAEGGARMYLIGFASDKNVDPQTYFDLKDPLPTDKRLLFLSVAAYERIFKAQP